MANITDDLSELYATVPLNYKYVQIPTPEDPKNVPENHIQYYVNKVITNLTRQAFFHSGFKFTESKSWNASWGRQYNMNEYVLCKCWQKINHYAGAFLMGRKDNLHMRMTELKERIGELADFYPESYLLPKQQDELNKAWKKHPLWIVKPSASSRGNGIHLVSSEKAVPTVPGIVQYYIEKPLLIKKRKFDIRLYVLVSSIEPMRIYMHSAGMARFCTHPYVENSCPSDLYMHLTNFSLNKDDKDFKRSDGVHEDVDDSKWTIGFFMNYCESNGIDTKRLMKEFERITISTILAGMNEIKKTHKKMIPHHYTSYEMYGIDIMLDSELNAHLLEINISPSLSGMDSKLDFNMKYPLNLDLFRMARIIDCPPNREHPCPEVELIEKEFYSSITEQRAKDVLENNVDPWQNPVFADFVMIRDFVEESQIKSGFRLVFPIKETMDSFIPCYEKVDYFDTVFHSWVRKSEEEQKAVIENNFHIYSDKLKEIQQKCQLIESIIKLK